MIRKIETMDAIIKNKIAQKGCLCTFCIFVLLVQFRMPNLSYQKTAYVFRFSGFSISYSSILYSYYSKVTINIKDIDTNQ